ncbi:MAG TPA: hypothetical protein VH641_21370 [Streptosporangiaceae bacterium]
MADEEMLDARTAAALVEQTQRRTRDLLEIKLPVVYAAWGIAWLLGLGAMWLSVRGQRPYRGPSAASSVILTVLLVAAVVITISVVTRATRGVGGVSAMQRRIYGLSWPVGFAALFALDGAVAHRGASPQVMGVLSAAGPQLITGLIYLLAAAIWLDWPMGALGIWLAALAGAGAWAGPVGVLLIGAIGGGGGFLVTAAVTSRRRGLAGAPHD